MDRGTNEHGQRVERSKNKHLWELEGRLVTEQSEAPNVRRSHLYVVLFHSFSRVNKNTLITVI